jgi:hypothetical protein
MSTSESDTIWYLDTGASNHMTGHKHLFAEMTELEGSVSFGDASNVEVKGKENVKFLQKNWRFWMIENVYFILEIKSNILSVRQLMEKGFEIFMKNRTLHLKDKQERQIARVEMGENRMFKLNLRRIKEKCLKVNKEDEVWIWHMRFGHLRSRSSRCKDCRISSSRRNFMKDV